MDYFSTYKTLSFYKWNVQMDKSKILYLYKYFVEDR